MGGPMLQTVLSQIFFFSLSPRSYHEATCATKTNKDLAERRVASKQFLQSALHTGTLHTLQVFCCEVSTEKDSISMPIQETVFDIHHNMMYAKSEVENKHL